MRDGELASNVHRAVADTFAKHGFALGHLSGHSIGTTMLEYPAIGAKSEVPLEENMIFSLHPQVVDQDGKVCLYTQDTYRIGKTEGECLADVPWKFYTGEETRQTAATITLRQIQTRSLSMKICVVGCGAVGSLFAAHLAQSGRSRSWAYDVWKEHTDAIRKNGLRLSGAADFTAQAECDQRSPKNCRAATTALSRPRRFIPGAPSTQRRTCFDDNSAVCSVQNGVGNEEIIAEQVKYVIRGTTFPAGHPVAPGHIGFDIKGDTWIGPFEPTNTPCAKVEELAGLITRSGMNTIPLERCARRAVDQTDL